MVDFQVFVGFCADHGRWKRWDGVEVCPGCEAAAQAKQQATEDTTATAAEEEQQATEDTTTAAKEDENFDLEDDSTV